MQVSERRVIDDEGHRDGDHTVQPQGPKQGGPTDRVDRQQQAGFYLTTAGKLCSLLLFVFVHDFKLCVDDIAVLAA